MRKKSTSDDRTPPVTVMGRRLIDPLVQISSGSDGFFLVLNGESIAKSVGEEWVSLLPGRVVRDNPNEGIVIEPLRSAPSKRTGRGRLTRR